MKKLIKIDNQYIVVDDSEIRVGDWIYNVEREPSILKCIGKGSLRDWKKITHSTIGHLYQDSIKPLSLSEMEELTKGYSVEKMAEEQFPYPIDIKDKNNSIIVTKGEKPFNHAKIEKYRRIWCQGFNAHQELVKDKLFTIEDMIKCFNAARETSGMNQRNQYGKKYLKPMYFIQSLLPLTEWEIEIDEQGKIKIIK
jgi:hypothetical protein